MDIYSYTVRARNGKGWGQGYGPRPTHCATCHTALPVPSDTGGAGYGCSDEANAPGDAPKPDKPLRKGEILTRSLAHCYDCCAAQEKTRMTKTGRAILYLVDSQASAGRAWTVQDWAGKLCFPVTHCRKSRSVAFGGYIERHDVRFTGPDGTPWYGVNKGDNQLVRCRRLK